MSLAFSFQLTPAQTQLLLTCAFGHYDGGSEISGPLPSFESSRFVTAGRRLIDKGLLSHSNERTPTWLPTETGIHMARLIVADAKKLVALEETAKPVPKPVKKRANALK
jgi:hypothetical protein